MAFYMVEAQLTDLGLRPLAIAADLGLAPVLVTNSPERYAGLHTFDPVVRQRSRVLLADTNDADAVHRAIAADGDEVEAVFTICDYNLAIAAEVATRFGLPTLTPAAARGAADKLVSRQRLVEGGVPVPRFRNVADATELAGALDLVGLPCVIKPMTDSASVGVRLCYTRQEAEAHFAELAADPVNARGQQRRPGALVEQYVLGYEVSVETFYAGGEHRVLGVTDKRIGGAPAFAEVGEDFPSLLPPDRVALAADLARAGLAAIGHDFGAAHTEIRISGSSAYLIEINGRVGGDDIFELVHRGTGVDVLAAAVALAAGRPAELAVKPEPTGVAWRALSTSVAGKLVEARGLDLARRLPGVVEVELHVPLGAAVHPLRSNHDVVGHVLAEAASAAEASRIADAAVQQVVLDVHPLAPA